jgi:hypothetical protein
MRRVLYSYLCTMYKSLYFWVGKISPSTQVNRSFGKMSHRVGNLIRAYRLSYPRKKTEITLLGIRLTVMDINLFLKFVNIFSNVIALKKAVRK